MRGSGGWVDPDARGPAAPGLDGPPERALEVLFEATPAVWMRRIPDRETFAWPDERGAYVVKRFRGDPPAERPLLLRWPPRLAAPRSPGRREGENLRELAELGIEVPEVAGWWQEPAERPWPRPRWGRSAVLMRRVDHTETLADACRARPMESARRWLGPLAELVARLHGAGWYHRDLYLHHLAIARPAHGADGVLVLLDVGRARREPRPRRRWFVKDLAALDHSAPASIGPRTRLRFLLRYARLRGITEREALRGLARAARLKARRIAAHVPRHVDPGAERAR